MRSWLVYKLSAYLTAGFHCHVTLCCKYNKTHMTVFQNQSCGWWFLQMSCKTDLTLQDSQRFQILSLVDPSWKASTWIFSSQSEYFWSSQHPLRKKTEKLWTGFSCDKKWTLQQACEVWIVAVLSKLTHYFLLKEEQTMALNPFLHPDNLCRSLGKHCHTSGLAIVQWCMSSVVPGTGGVKL